MTDAIKHKFASAKANSPDSTLVSKTSWNDDHVLAGGLAATRTEIAGRVDVRDFSGVDLTGANSSTAGVRLAIAQAEAVKFEIYFPGGTYALDDVGEAELFLTQYPLVVRAAGMGRTIFLIDSSVPVTTDVWHIKPASSAEEHGWLFEEFQILPLSGTPARHAFNLDGSAAGVSGPQFVDIHRISQTHDLGGFSLYSVPGAAAFQTFVDVHDNAFGSGVDFSHLSIVEGSRINHNWLFGGGSSSPTKGVTVVPRSGSGKFEFMSNFITAAGGVTIANATALRFEHNDYEQFITSTHPRNTQVELGLVAAGCTAAMQDVSILFNSINGHDNVLVCLKLDWMNQPILLGNTLNAVSGYDLILTSNTENAVILPNLYAATTPARRITNGGVGTLFLGTAGTYAGNQSALQLTQPTDGDPGLVLTRHSAGATGPLIFIQKESGGQTFLQLHADGTLDTAGGVNAQQRSEASLTEATAIGGGAYTDTALTIPAKSVVLGVSVYVVATIPTAATFTVTGASAGTFNTAAVSTAAGSNDPGTLAGAFYNAAAQHVRITPNIPPITGTGSVRVTVHYYTVTPPTS